MHGSAVPAASVSRAVGTVAPGRAVQAVIAFKPRNAFLLRRLALHASGRPGLGEARIRSLFAPDPAHVRSVRAYLAAQGLEVTAHTDMTLTVAGPAAAAEHAFGVGLSVYRSPAGAMFHAPAGAIRLPAQIASSVQAVGGLDTSVRLRPASGRPRLHRLAAGITPTCAGATSAQQTLGGYLPADLGGNQAYGHNNLIAGGADGSGEQIGMVEFSGYARSDVDHFRSCFPGITGTYAPDAIVGGSNPDMSGKGEVALDLEVAMERPPTPSCARTSPPTTPTSRPRSSTRCAWTASTSSATAGARASR